MPTPATRVFNAHLDLKRSRLLRAGLELVTGNPATDNVEGRIAFDATSGAQRIIVCLNPAGSGTWAKVPRLDLAEIVTSQWSFNASVPFSVGSSTMVTNLNANYLQGRLSDQALSNNTIAVRDGGGRLHVQDAIDPTHAVNLRQLESAVAGRKDLNVVRVATTAPLPAFTVVGNVITGSVNGALPAQDGVTLAPGDALLVKDEVGTNKRYHGPYVIGSLGSPTTKFSMTRRADTDESAEVFIGITCLVDEGVANQKSYWTLIDANADPVVLNTTELTFGKTGGNTLFKDGNGLTLVGDTFHLGDGNPFTVGDLFFASDAANLGRLAAVAAGNVLISAGVGAAPAWGKVGLTTHVTGLLPIAQGGTNSAAALTNGRVMVSQGGQIVERAALTAGWLTVGDAASGIAPLGSGAANRIVGINASNTGHEHKALVVTSAGVITSGVWQGNVVAPQYGGTGLGAYTVGDLLVASAPSVLSALGAVAAGSALISNGAGAMPVWGKIGLTSHVTGVLPVLNGGLGLNNFVIGDLLYASAADTLAPLPAVAVGSVLVSNGVGAPPIWSKVNLATHVVGTLPGVNGGTGQSTWAVGDTLYASGVNTLSKRTIGTLGQVMRVVTGLVPNWVTLTAGDVGAIGGTGTANRVAKFTGAGAVGNANIEDSGTLVRSLANLQTDKRLLVTGDGAGHLALTAFTPVESSVPVGGMAWDGGVLYFKLNAAFTGGNAGFNMKRVAMLMKISLTSANATAGIHTALGITMTITHNLGNPDPIVSWKDTTNNNDDTEVNWRPADANNIEVFFPDVPASGQFVATIVG